MNIKLMNQSDGMEKVDNLIAQLCDSISRDLHDEVGQELTSIKLLSEHMLVSTKMETVHQCAENICKSLASIDYHFHNLLHNIKSNQVLKRSFSNEIRDMINRWKEINNQKVIFNLHGKVDELDAKYHENIYRIVQEGLTNISRHACSEKVEITIAYRQNKLILKVKDNGVGINSSQVPSDRLGLRGIVDRVAELGGEFSCYSDNGTYIDISFKTNGELS